MPAADYSYDPDPAFEHYEAEYEDSPPVVAPFVVAAIVTEKCPALLGASYCARGDHSLYRCRTCAGNGYIVTEEA